MPLALVIDWNDHYVRVYCPYCFRIHRHGVGDRPWTRQTRQSHCDRGRLEERGSRRYQMCYPYEDPAKAEYAYEIDKKNGCFVTVDVTGLEDDEDEGSYDRKEATVTDANDVEEMQEQLDNLTVHDSERPQGMPDPDENDEDPWENRKWRLSMFFSFCINDDIEGVEDLTKTYQDPFITATDIHRENCISFAAIEGHSEMIRFLCEKGRDLNNVNKKRGRP